MKFLRSLFLGLTVLCALYFASSTAWEWPSFGWARKYQKPFGVGAGLGTAGALAYLAYITKDPNLKAAAALASVAVPLGTYWWWQRKPQQPALSPSQFQLPPPALSLPSPVSPPPSPASRLKGQEIEWGLYERQGGTRSFMEDRYDVQLKFRNNPSNIFFGLYDGNGIASDPYIYDVYGLSQANQNKIPVQISEVAAKGYAKDIPSLSSLIANSSISDDSTYKKAFLIFDGLWMKNFHSFDSMYGSINNPTATMAVVVDINFGGGDPKAVIAWTGDSRALAIYNDGRFYITPEHTSQKTDDLKSWVNLEEYKRIARIIRDRYKLDQMSAKKNTATRQLGAGDVEEVIIAEPEIKRLDNLDEYRAIVLVCDGVFETLEDKEVAQIINDVLSGKEVPYIFMEQIIKKEENFLEAIIEAGNSEKCKLAARIVVDEALMKGSNDNLSVLVIDLQSVLGSRGSSSSSSSPSSGTRDEYSREGKGKGKEIAKR